MYKEVLEFYKNKRVLITGHTGFKGCWLSKVLISAGAKVCGYSLEAPTTPNLFNLCNVHKEMESYIADIRDYEKLNKYISILKPEIVFHLAAQPIVRESYKDPRNTYETNIMGTVNLLESVRSCDSVQSVINITTDKVYHNKEWCWGYRENEELDGFDPYSNSKSCSELVTSGYRNSFFMDRSVAISTARAGNVIGGGDFAKDRVLPDCLRAITNKDIMVVRNPNSIRPYQHVLEAIFAYMIIAEKQYNEPSLSGAYNVGPDSSDCWSTGKLVDQFCQKWNNISGDNLRWEHRQMYEEHEANFLKLDNSKIKSVLGWKPNWSLERALEKVVEWDKAFVFGDSIDVCMNAQIVEYFGIQNLG